MITTAHLNIRLMQESDWSFLVDLLNSKDFIENIGDKKVRDKHDAIAYMNEGPLSCYKKHGYSLMIMELYTGKSVGICGLIKRDHLDSPDLGYAIMPEFYRCGYTQESAMAVLEHFKHIRPIYGLTNQTNIASQQLLIKLGFCQKAAPTDEEAGTVFFVLE